MSISTFKMVVGRAAYHTVILARGSHTLTAVNPSIVANRPLPGHPYFRISCLSGTVTGLHAPACLHQPQPRSHSSSSPQEGERSRPSQRPCPSSSFQAAPAAGTLIIWRFHETTDRLPALGTLSTSATCQPRHHHFCAFPPLTLRRPQDSSTPAQRRKATK
jgi:hypothetical protein